MKQLYILLSILFTIPISTHASHLRGGEITWKCLSNGQYQFYMYLYRECSGLHVQFTTKTIEVSGTGIPLNSIIMYPDSAKFVSLNNGNISHSNTSGTQASCSINPPQGVIQAFPFVSDPITLGGIPPASGVVFSWGGSTVLESCCRSNILGNIVGPSAERFYLHSIMYPYENQSLSTCYDNSAKFIDVPTQVIQQGPYNFSNAAWDVDLDSLVYEFDDPLSDGLNDPVSWKTGYSTNSPLPSTVHHTWNAPAFMESMNGHVTGIIHGGVQYNEYVTSIRVDSYRKGVKISSIWRDMVIANIIEPGLPGIGGFDNAPVFRINGILDVKNLTSVEVGEKAKIPIQVKENDIIYEVPNDPTTARVQKTLLTAKGLFFSQDFSDSSNCILSGLSPCATLTPTPVFNPLSNQYELIGLSAITTLFEWQTSCDLLQAWENQKHFNFVMGVVDEQFSNGPVVKHNATITIEVNRKQTEIVQNGDQLTVLDTGTSYQWYRNDTLIPNADSSSILLDQTGVYSVLVDGNTSCAYQKAFYNVEGCVLIIDTISNCNSIVWRDGITYTESTSSPKYILPNPNGCDTVVKLNLSINKTTYYTDSIFSCNRFTWLNGTTYTRSTNIPKHVMTNSEGCDSIISLNLKIIDVDTSVVQIQNTLKVNQDSVIYQWLDCNNALAAIPGETDQIFAPSKNGMYACEITKEGCKDTTSCSSFYFIGLEEYYADKIKIYPNPSNGNFNVELNDNKGDVELKVTDLNGKEVQVSYFKKQNRVIIDSPKASPGIYFLNLIQNGKSVNYKLLIL